MPLRVTYRDAKTYPEYSSLWRPVSTCTESGRLMINKYCTGCEESKPLKEFHKNGSKPDGTIRYKSKCKECSAEDKSKLVTFIRNKYSKIQDRYRSTQREDLRCDMTMDEFIMEVNDQLQWSAFTCPITDISLTHQQSKKHKMTNLSIDRINPNKGYTKDNMMVTSWMWNTMKSNNELKYMIRFCTIFKYKQPDMYNELYKEALDMFFEQSKKSKKFIKMLEEFEKDKVEEKSVSQLLQEGFEREQNEME